MRQYAQADVAVAVSTDTGLITPIVRAADRKTLSQISAEIADLAARARAGQLRPEEYQGGSFSVSNLGMHGVGGFSAIINPPQSAVLGLHRIEDRPVVRDGQIVIRPMMYLALSYDHRLIDGREAVTFLVAVKNAIEDPTRLLIDL